jgi:hypothetical protein
MSIQVGTHIYPNTEEGRAAAKAREAKYGGSGIDTNEDHEKPAKKSSKKAKKKAE